MFGGGSSTVRLQSAGKSASKAPRAQYIVLAFVAFLVTAVIALQFPLTASRKCVEQYLLGAEFGGRS